MTTSRKRLLSKIQKLLALGTSPEPHEAASALNKARALMAAHDLDEHDVAAAEVTRRNIWRANEPDVPTLWTNELACTIARAFGCRAQYWRGDGWSFVGLGASPEVAEYSFVVLRRRCTVERAAHYKRLRGKRVNRIRRADQFALGWVFSVSDTVERFAPGVPDVVTDFIARTGSGNVVAPRGTRSDRDWRDLMAGIDAGAAVNLQRAANAAAPTRHLTS